MQKHPAKSSIKGHSSPTHGRPSSVVTFQPSSLLSESSEFDGPPVTPTPKRAMSPSRASVSSYGSRGTSRQSRRPSTRGSVTSVDTEELNMEDMKYKVRRAKKKLDNAREQLKIERLRCNDIITEKNDIVAQLREEEKRVESLKSENAALRKQLATMRQEKKQFVKIAAEHGNAVRKSKQLEERLETVEAELKHKEQELEEERKRRVKSMHEDLVLKERLSEEQGNYREYREKYEKAQQELRRRDREEAKLRRRVHEALEKQEEAEKESRQRLKRTLADEREMAVLRRGRDTLSTTVVGLTERYEAMRKAFFALQYRVQQASVTSSDKSTVVSPATELEFDLDLKLLSQTISQFGGDEAALHEKITELATSKAGLKGLKPRKKPRSLPTLSRAMASTHSSASAGDAAMSGTSTAPGSTAGNGNSSGGSSAAGGSGYLTKGSGGVLLTADKGGGSSALGSALPPATASTPYTSEAHRAYHLDDKIVQSILAEDGMLKSIRSEHALLQTQGSMMYKLSKQQRSRPRSLSNSMSLSSSKARYLGSGLRLPRDTAVLTEDVKDPRTRGSVRTLVKALVSDNPEIQKLRAKEDSRISNY